jgi:flagellar biosynthesis/type III secretory pathway protein FliH
MSIYEEAREHYDSFYQQGKSHGYEEGLRAGKQQASAWPSFISELLNGASYLFMIAGFVYFIFIMGQLSAVTELAKLKLEERERQKVEKTAEKVSAAIPGTVVTHKGDMEIRVK